VPITFDAILIANGIRPETVHLVRHQDLRWGADRTPYGLWYNDRENFESYQNIQRRRVFIVGNLVASFVVTPGGDTLFAGFYEVGGIGKAPEGTTDPLGRHDVSDHFLYELNPDSRLDEFIGKLIIDWGPGFRSWVQRAGRREKRVLELRREIREDEFPGYLRFVTKLSELERLPSRWKDLLTQAKGVYVITCPRDKEHYVGSAGGREGFFGRWMQHLTIGGDAVQFEKREPSEYLISILQVVGSDIIDEEIVRIEQVWMDKLQSRRMGLNGNSILHDSSPKQLP
jgi:hypothetical protein